MIVGSCEGYGQKNSLLKLHGRYMNKEMLEAIGDLVEVGKEVSALRAKCDMYDNLLKAKDVIIEDKLEIIETKNQLIKSLKGQLHHD